MPRTLLVLLVLLSIALIMPPPGYGQVDYSTATLKGTVLDPQHLLVAGANVTIQNPSTGFSKSVVTGGDGEYRFPLLTPGTYQIQVEAKGFAKAAGSVSLTVGQIANYDIHMEIGSMSATVEVSGEAALVQTEQTQQANTIGERQVIDLPNLARDFTGSVFTLPGVSKSEAPRAQNPGFSGFQSSGFSIGGSNGRNNLVTIDGGENDYGSGQLRTPHTPVDSIQEFQVNRSSFAAEFGFTSGTAVNIVTRTGTNEFHGSVYAFFRNQSTDAANYFAPETGSKATEQNFVPGVTFGGPIIKNKLFFFTSYEFTKTDTPQFRSYATSAVAQPFSSNAAQIKYVNQLAGSGDPNLLPIAGLLQFVLTPASFPDTARLLNPNTGTFNDWKKFHNWVTRVDYQPSSNDTVSARFALMNDDSSRMYILDPLNSWDDATLQYWRDYTVLGSWSHVFSPHLLNQLRVQVVPSDTAKVPVVSPDTAYLTLGSLGNFQGEHYEPYNARQRRFQFEDSVTWTKGRHAMKFGGSYRPVSYMVNDQLWMRGEFNFYDGAIPLIAPLSSLLSPDALAYLAKSEVGLPGPDITLSALQSFDLGIPVAFRQGFGNPQWQGWGHNLGVYAQDSWKVTPTFTVDFGGRMDYSAEASPVPHHVFFSPRVGFAWNPRGDQKTVIRGGGGVFVAPVPFYNDYILNLLGGSGKYINQFASSISEIDPNTLLPIPVELWGYGVQTGKLPFGQLTEADLNALGFQVPGQNNQVIVNTNRNFQNVHSVQASLSVQRELVHNMSLEVAYQMYHGLHQQLPIDTNVRETGAIDPFVGPIYTQINPKYTQIETYSSVGSSIYHGVTASLTRRFTNGLQFQANYTYSRAIDDNTDFNNNFLPFRPTRIDLERGVSAFNITHNFVASAVYTTPFTHGGNALSRVLADITLSPILSIRTGIPFTIRVPGLQNGTLGESLYARPWNAGRNTGIGPNFYGLDMRVNKAFYINRERGLKLDVLVEGTNILNHTNFSAVNDQLPADPTFALPNGGTLLSGPYHFSGFKSSDPTLPLAFKSAFDARQVQFGLKFIF
ncbi:MAG: TonB-dependent receptor [Acidobacteriia bacterium]|nr:TonB-dependent receptor [Terriglobia bacterium]